MNRPAETEYPEFYHAYVSKTEGAEIIKTLENANAETVNLIKAVSDQKGSYAYAEAKWTLNEVINT